jgi:two-component system, NarL family, sensor kinase
LGRELHDGLAQSVLAVRLDLAQVARTKAALKKKGRQALGRARKTLPEMSRQIRTLSYLLHPPVLDEMGLGSAVKEYARGFEERSGVELEVEVEREIQRLGEEAETALFRIVQESLANIQKHSGSATGKIRLRASDGWVELDVSDKGRGIAAGPDAHGTNAPKGARLGVGILGMRERMTQFGGTLEVESSGQGTTVRAKIPLRKGGNHGTPSHSYS